MELLEPFAVRATTMSTVDRYQSNEKIVTIPRGGQTASLAAIVNELEEDIVFGRLHPRERLIEDELLARFAAKRHIVRQAFGELERMGLVERIPNRGAMVRACRPDEVKQLYFLRDLLETEAARLIPLPLPEADLADLRASQASHDTAVFAGDLRRVFRANIIFHRTLFSKCENAYLAETINDFAQRVHGIRFYSLTEPGYVERARQEHWEMIAAMENDDRGRLVDLCRRHIVASKEAYLRAYSVYGA